MKSIETNFRNFLVEKLDLNKNQLHRHNSGETPVHLRFMSNNGINTFEKLKDALDSLGLKYTYADYKYFSRSPDYGDQGLHVEFNNQIVGVQFNVQESGRIRRKELNPKCLGLDGLEFNDPKVFRNVVDGVIRDHEFGDCLISMLDNIDTGAPVRDIEKIAIPDVNRITSDFGESLCAYSAILNGKTVCFPSKSNNNIADYYENGQAVSAKGRKTGGKVNLTQFKNLIDQSTITGKFLYSIATWDRDDFFKYAAELSPEVGEIAEMVGGTTGDDVKQFVANTDYDTFYDFISSKPDHKGLGLPKGKRPRKLWEQGSVEPFYFTINTLISRLWGQININNISKIVVKFLKGPKFITIDIINNKVVINEIEFSSIKKWQTIYWSRATKAFHNWMAVEPVNGMNQ